MTLAEFVAQYSGRWVIFPGHRFGPQCVDLVEFYVTQVLGAPQEWLNAIDWYGTETAFVSWQRNRWGDRSSKPEAGAIVVWGPNAVAGTGVYGHVAICTDPGDGLTFGSFQQNYPTGSPCHVQPMRYDGVIGWGDRIAPPPPPPADPCAAVKTALAAEQAARASLAADLKAWRDWGALRPV